ncbi:MAG: hypothetical protein AAGC47_10045, partial [Bacteroidota bacterium]
HWIFIGIAFYLISLLGKWAGKMIRDENKSSYSTSFISLGTIFGCLFFPTGLVPLIFLEIVLVLILAKFMGREIEKSKDRNNF